MNNSTQNIIHLAIIIVVAAIFFAIAPVHDKQVHGILLPSQSPLKPVTDMNIPVYQSKPAGAISLGLINTAKHFESESKAANEKNFKDSMAFAKKLGAGYGANGLVFLQAYPGDTGPLDSFASFWEPIYVKSKGN